MSKNSINRLLLIVGSVVSVATLFGVECACSDFVFGAVDSVTLSIPSSCMISATGDTTHEIILAPGVMRNAESSSDPISKSRITATCNDANGYSIYAIGYSNDVEGTTDMIAGDPLTSESNIATGNATTGNISNWGMKVIASTGTDAPTINTTDENGTFADYRAVPTTYTKVASKASGVVTTNTSYIDTAYQVFVSTNQPAGSYSGKVKYILVNPSTKDCPDGYTLNGSICEKNSGVTVTFNANGGSFGGNPANVLTYSAPTTTTYPVVTETTSSTDDTEGLGNHKTDINSSLQYVQNANYYQDLTLNTNAPGPYDLTIYYATEYVSYDWICVFDGTSYEPGIQDDCSDPAAIAPITNIGDVRTDGNKIGGPGSDYEEYGATATFKVNNKTARIYFTSDDYDDHSYGYWAEFTGGGEVVVQNLISGSYIDKPDDRTDYIFLGWATTSDATEPNWTYDVDAVVMADTTIYAVWLKANTFENAFMTAGKEKYNGTDYYAMQDMSADICNNVSTVPSTVKEHTISTQLIDTRDNKIYWVSKLADGNCWMTQNLDYDLSNTSLQSLSSSTSNVSSSTTVTPVSWGWDYNSVYFYEGGDKYLPNGTGSATNITCNSTTNGGEDCHYHVGNYYSWYAATAGSGTTSINNADVTSSICPKGWRLPTSNSYDANYSFGKLTNAYGITNNDYNDSSDAALLASPLWFVRAGSTASDLSYQGEYGSVWSSSAGSGDARFLYFYSIRVEPSSGAVRNFGRSVRCVAW